MLSVRNAVISASLLFVLAIGFSLLNMVQTPDSDGQAVDSYGIRGRGFRGMYETLERLNIPVTRSVIPPEVDRLNTDTIVFADSNPLLVGFEPSYLSALQTWVNDGGRIVVTAPSMNSTLLNAQLAQMKERPPTILESLGLADVQVVSSRTKLQKSFRSREEKPRQTRDADQVVGDFFDAMTASLPPLMEADVQVTGEFPLVEDAVQRLTIPADGVAFLSCDRKPDGAVIWSRSAEEGEAEASSEVAGDKEVILAARFRQGRGEIIVVAEASLFSNRLLAKSDNALLATYVLTPGGGSVQFDEFYHGLGVRGQPLYLLTRLSYASVSLSILILLGVWTWRRSVFPGPPLQDETVRRRDISEYISAMGRFFAQDRRARRRLVAEVRNGVLRQLNDEFMLPPDGGDLNRVVAAVERSNPRRAKNVADAIRSVDKDLSSDQKWSEKKTIDAMRRLTACL